MQDLADLVEAVLKRDADIELPHKLQTATLPGSKRITFLFKSTAEINATRIARALSRRIPGYDWAISLSSEAGRGTIVITATINGATYAPYVLALLLFAFVAAIVAWSIYAPTATVI